jgi:hypothetical protein
MKHLLLFSISLLPFKCFAQNDTAEIRHSHRFYINPTQIITGQYTLAYAWNLNGGRKWYEIGAGYQYLPYSLIPWTASSNAYSTPKLGAGFTGPVLSFALTRFYVKVKRKMREDAVYDQGLQEMIRHAKPLNSIRYELQYQYLQHRADCYYAGEEDDEYTYSSVKHCLSAKVLYSKLLRGDEHHVMWESYIGIGLHGSFGQATKYMDNSIPVYGSNDYCVHDIHDPNVFTTSEHFGYLIPMIHMGIRMGFQ